MRGLIRRAVPAILLLLPSALWAGPANYNFDNLFNFPRTTFTDTQGGVQATFSSNDGSNAFGVSQSFLSTMSGLVLSDSDSARHTLVISFSTITTSFSFLYGLDDPSNTSFLSVNLFLGLSPVGSFTATGTIPNGDLYPQGLFSRSGVAFDSLQISSTAQNFAIDQLNTVNNLPEPGSLAMMFVAGLIAIAVGVGKRLRPAPVVVRDTK